MLFTNALEHVGARFKISDGITGSLFAAVATALPETLVPVLALLAGTSDIQVNEEIGVGAILGAPLMLATLSSCLMGLSIIRRRGLRGLIRPEHTGLRRDLNTFLFAFSLAAIAMFVPEHDRSIRATLSAALVVTYIIYIINTLRASQKLVDTGHGTSADNPLFLARIGLPSNLAMMFFQLILGLVVLIIGAKMFINGVHDISALVHVSSLLLSLLIIPIATELPEKINSIIWIHHGKDTLAFGNITGAMVFQGTLLPAIGIMLTPWEPRIEVFTGVIVVLLATVWLRFHAKSRGFPVWVLMINGVLYVSYLTITLSK